MIRASTCVAAAWLLIAALQAERNLRPVSHTEWHSLSVVAASGTEAGWPRPPGLGSRGPGPDQGEGRRSCFATRQSGNSRLSIAAQTRQGAVPATGDLPLDRRQTQSARHRAVRRRQVVAQLRTGAEGLPRWLHLDQPRCREAAPRAAIDLEGQHLDRTHEHRALGYGRRPDLQQRRQ